MTSSIISVSWSTAPVPAFADVSHATPAPALAVPSDVIPTEICASVWCVVADVCVSPYVTVAL